MMKILVQQKKLVSVSKKLFFILVMALFFLPKNGTAQTRVLTGKVTDTKGNELIAVTVAVKGTSIGAITSLTGDFSLNLPSDNKDAVLLISSIGYESLEIVVGTRVHFDIQLAEKTELLDEVVVVGYGTQRKVDLTGSVSKVNMS
ncbi:MAG: carboxypeptidase-like regulatory domain-containing protein, partial [Bacteroidales bacterium]|nr:carboxypeptidase-like regulatory domain-containing protein [Bacteroidales bacterium]